jgi:hypothetical protein
MSERRVRTWRGERIGKGGLEEETGCRGKKELTRKDLKGRGDQEGRKV